MANIRSVIKNPPTTFIVASAIATTEKIVPIVELILEAIIIAPTITIPDIALDPDINGVYRVGGTLVITSYPINIAKTKIIIKGINSNLLLL